MSLRQLVEGKVVGSILITVGAGIGAGMLAIPIVTAQLGFALSSLLLTGSWLVMLFSGSLILHVNMAFPERANFSTMALHTVGRLGHILLWICFLALFYAILAAYITGGTSLLTHAWNRMFHLQPHPMVSAIPFTAACALFVYSGTQPVDYASRLLVGCKMVAIVLVLAFLAPSIRLENLSRSAAAHSNWLMILPILITSFSYHSVIPSLRDYLHSSVKKLSHVLLIGGTIPLVIYLLWEIMILGIIPDLGPETKLADMMRLLAERLDNPAIQIAANVFVNIALATSFLCVALSLFHFICDGFHLKESRPSGKLIGIFLTFLPPLGFAWFYPEGFLLALRYAGIFTVFLFMLLPVWMALALRKKRMKSAHPFKLHWASASFIVIAGLVILIAQCFNL